MKRKFLVAYRGEASQAHMGKRYGVSQQAWCKWENGKAAPNVLTMKQLELDSGIPMETLFSDLFNNLNGVIGDIKRPSLR